MGLSRRAAIRLFASVARAQNVPTFEQVIPFRQEVAMTDSARDGFGLWIVLVLVMMAPWLLL